MKRTPEAAKRNEHIQRNCGIKGMARIILEGYDNP
jgi:hypothetical protein